MMPSMFARASRRCFRFHALRLRSATALGWMRVTGRARVFRDQTERDTMESFWTATLRRRTKTEQYGQLIALPGLKHAFRSSDIATMRRWLRVAQVVVETRVARAR